MSMAAAAPLNPVSEHLSLLQKLMFPSPEFALYGEQSPRRAPVEAYIAEHFERQYEAQVEAFLPHLLTMQCQASADLSAAVGLRSAKETTLFLEQYFEQPVEQALSARVGEPVARNQVVEIGNLVATRRGASHLLFILTAAILSRTSTRWLVFTATDQVAQILRKLKFPTVTLCQADAAKLHHEPEQWGQYYKTNPQVLAGDLSQAVVLLSKNRMMRSILAHYDDTITNLSRQFQVGIV